MSNHTITSRPPSPDELFMDHLSRTPTDRKSALGVWEETRKVMAGMPRGDLLTRVAYLKYQQGLDQANIDRLIRQEVRVAFRNRSDIPGWGRNGLDQTGDVIGPLAQNVAFLAGNPDYAEQDPNTLLHYLATGWRPLPGPNVPVQSLADRLGSGLKSGLHHTAADLYDAGAATTQVSGQDAWAAYFRGRAQAQRDQAAAYAAPGPDAGFPEKVWWQIGSGLGKWGPAVAAGGIPALATRGVLGPVARGILAAVGEGAYAGLTAAGRTDAALVQQGVPPGEAAYRALAVGAAVAGAGATAPQLPAGAFGPGTAAQLGTMGVNEGVRGVMENRAEWAARKWLGINDH